MAMAHLRIIVAGEVAVAWREFGGMGVQLSNLTFLMELAPKANQEAAANFSTEQSHELQRIARRRQEIKQIECQLRQPDQMLASRAAEGPKKEYEARTEKGGKEPPRNRYRALLRRCVYGSSWKSGGISRYFKG